MCKEKLKKYPFLVCYITLQITTYNNIAIIVNSEQKKIHTYIRTYIAIYWIQLSL